MKPAFRRRGHGRRLAESLVELSMGMKLPLRHWVSFADYGEENRPALVGLLGDVGLSLRDSPDRSIAYVALPSANHHPLSPVVIPGRPCASRRAKAAAALLAGAFSIAPKIRQIETVPSHDSISVARHQPVAPRIPTLAGAAQVPFDHEHDEAVEIEIEEFIDVPPISTVSMNGLLTSITRGSTDLPLSESDWANLGLDYAEDH